ncbi:MAG: hypothetical protein D3923_13460 [Candidatus Electrothrix sp. AR3]|nr:hypothetical protein [Candidatus Electrothrix sp. AR3]
MQPKSGGSGDCQLITPEKIRTLQRKLYIKAKQEPAYRFYALYDKITRADFLGLVLTSAIVLTQPALAWIPCLFNGLFSSRVPKRKPIGRT